MSNLKDNPMFQFNAYLQRNANNPFAGVTEPSDAMAMGVQNLASKEETRDSCGVVRRKSEAKAEAEVDVNKIYL